MSESISYEEYLTRFGSLTYTNVGTSMLPLLREGRDLFVLRPKEATRCRVGDVILYRRPPAHYVLHRVVACTPVGYVTLGDNSLARESVREDDVIGVMDRFVRQGKEHGTDEIGYRVYTWLVLHLATPRVAIMRTLSGINRRLAGGLRG